MPSNVADLEMEYKQMDEEMTNVSSKDDVFSIQPSGKLQMNIIFRLFNWRKHKDL